MSRNPLDEIRTALDTGRVVPFIGAGIPKAAANLPVWSELFDRGIQYLRQFKDQLQLAEEDIDALATLGRSRRLADTFEMLQTMLGGAPQSEHYHTFLTANFDDPDITSMASLEALRNLQCPVFVTTNYDLLLEHYCHGSRRDTVTWLTPPGILSLLRGGSGVIHLHGRYDVPNSVILSSSDYKRVVSATDTRRVARSLFDSAVLLFIGCSLDGVNDPHLGKILEGFAELQGPAGSEPHFMLVKGDPSAKEKTDLRRLGVRPVTYGDSFEDLPEFLDGLTQSRPVRIDVERLRPRLHAVRTATSMTEVLTDVKAFLEGGAFRGREVRIALAKKIEASGGRVILANVEPLPPRATHNEFSYPLTLAAWALLEGRILRVPNDLERLCDFDRLRQLGKYDRVMAALREVDPSEDPVAADYLDLQDVRARAEKETLRIRDIYQNWVGRHDFPHYRQFVSVPVPLLDQVANRPEPPEHFVINVDTKEMEPLLSARTRAHLAMAADLIEVGWRAFNVEATN